MERIIIDDSRFNFIPKVRTAYKAPPGLNERLIEEISHAKGEPEWMLKHRLESLKIFKEWHNPRFGVDISELDLGKIVSYIRPDAKRELPGKRYQKR